MPCFPSLSDLPEPPDAVVVAIPAPGVAAVVEEAGAIGCGGAVVYGAGFGEIAQGAAMERDLAEAARRHELPLCGPNGNGIVALHERVALWGDALSPLEPGRVALVSQSGNVAVNTLATRRGLRLHTVISCGNSAALDPADWIAQLAREEGVGSIAVYLEADGDGARLALALADCAERGVGVSVLKVGSSPAGALAAAAHTGAVAGDQRVFRALVEEAGAAWAEDVHELLELAKAQAVPERPAPDRGGRRPGGAHLLRRRLRPGCRLLRAQRPRPSSAGRGHLHAAARAAARRRHGRQPARLHGADLGRGGDPARHRGHRGRGRRDRAGAGALRPAHWNRGRGGRVVGRGARGHPRRRGREPGARDGLLHPPRAARRRSRRALRRRRDTRHRRPAHRTGVRDRAPHPAGRPGAPARHRRGRCNRGERTGPARRARGQGAACARPACRWWRAAWPPARRTPRARWTSSAPRSC